MSRLDKLPEIATGKTVEFPYKTVVFDLDGTLYDQTKLRINMAVRLGIYYVSHFWRIKELFVLKYFREVRDKWDLILIKEGELSEKSDSIDEQQYKYVAEKKNVSSEYVEKVVRKWIYDNPLDLLCKFRNEKLYSYIEELKSKGIPVIIFSDYPISDKIKALGITPDGMYCPGDERNIELKPSSMGLELIMKDYGLDKRDLLMVGDRDVKDGESARRAEVDYIIM